MTDFHPPGIRRSTVTALAVVAGVLVAAAALFVTLFLVERAGIARLDDDLAGIERKLDDANARLATGQSTVDVLDQKQVELGNAIAELRSCADPSKAAVVAANTGDDAGLDAAIRHVLRNCGR